MNLLVRSTDERFLELLHRYMGSFRVEERQPDEIVVSADCGLERVLPGGKTIRGRLNLYFGSMWIYRGRNMHEMAGRLASYVRSMATYFMDEFIRFRAGAVVLDGSALLLPSPPQPRLPSLVGLLLRQGGGYLGDEQVHLEPVTRRVHSSSLPLMIDSEDLSLFPALRRERLRPRRKEERPEDLRAV
ncbi:MAG: hypothetical protein ACRDHB_05740, partial [Actinomycetota bacterium]